MLNIAFRIFMTAHHVPNLFCPLHTSLTFCTIILLNEAYENPIMAPSKPLSRTRVNPTCLTSLWANLECHSYSNENILEEDA